jgi:CheY-like chemotaxis protein
VSRFYTKDYKALEQAGIYVNKITIDRNDKEKPRILVVEDTDIIIKVICLRLNQLGFKGRYEVATDAFHALEMLDNGYDVIICDIGLPDMDGIELIKKIRELNEKRIPIIACTGYPRWHVEEECKKIGCDYLLIKPPDFIEFENVLYSALKDFYQN